MLKQAMPRHEVKDNVSESADDDYRIVEAYGDRKYPKLVEQVASDIFEIRINALAVLCDEFNIPEGVFGCCVAGVIQVLAGMCTDPNPRTRDLASTAIALAARDTYGSSSILEEEVIPLIAEAMHDPSSEVRASVYECMYQLSRTSAGTLACVHHKVSSIIAKLLPKEDDHLRPLLLRCIHNLSSAERGLNDALDNDVVKLCITFLASDNSELRAESARTLGYLCFSDRGKDMAVLHGAVGELAVILLVAKEDRAMLSAGSLALMAVSSTDEGKRQLAAVPNCVELLVSLLHSHDKTVQLNDLKIIANAAVHPAVRGSLKKDEDCISTLERLAGGSDAFTKKHAKIALEAVMWKP